MQSEKAPPGYVRGLVVQPNHGALEAAANEMLQGRAPRAMADYAKEKRSSSDQFLPVETFGAIPLGDRVDASRTADLRMFREPKSKQFLVAGYVRMTSDGGIPDYLTEAGGAERLPIYSNPLIGELWKPPPRPLAAPPRCLPTCGTSEYVGDTDTVRQKLNVQALGSKRLNGEGVAIAIADSGIFSPRIARLLGDAMEVKDTPFKLEEDFSWKPPGLVTAPGKHRVGHGTMCAYDALIAAPKATLLDVPLLLVRPVADHHSRSMVSAALQAFGHLAGVWLDPRRPFDALVISNSWGLFHPCLEDFPPGHPGRFIDNPNHIFHYFTQGLSAAGVDIVFCGNNCGDGANCTGHCASGTCLSETGRMIMGANAYEHVLTIGGCDTNDALVGYSSRGPSINGMYPYKPDVVAYTHFLGSRVNRTFVPDTGVSAACPVAAGCVAALRTHPDLKPSKVSSAKLFKALRDTARKPAGMPAGWDDGYGYGVIDPVAAARSLGVQIP